MGKRKNSTKKERTELLKRLGYSELDMQKFWDECKEVNSKIRLLANSGLNWTDLCVWQIEQLPTLKETTLKKLAEIEEAKKKEEEERLKVEDADKYYQEHFDELMVKKIDNGEELTDNELKSLVFDCNEVECSYGENRRWTRTVTSIVNLCGRYFAVVWEQGLTESQENGFYNQPYEVELDSYKKVVEVRNWVRKGDLKPKRVNELKVKVSDEAINIIIDSVTEFMYCNYGDCHINEMTWGELEDTRECIKNYAMNMIKSNLGQ